SLAERLRFGGIHFNCRCSVAVGDHFPGQGNRVIPAARHQGHAETGARKTAGYGTAESGADPDNGDDVLAHDVSLPEENSNRELPAASRGCSHSRVSRSERRKLSPGVVCAVNCRVGEIRLALSSAACCWHFNFGVSQGERRKLFPWVVCAVNCRV